MKKIEGVVVHYDDGSHERLTAQELMERFFRGFVQDPSQNPTGDSPAVVEPEKNIQTAQEGVANVSFPPNEEVSTQGSNPETDGSNPHYSEKGKNIYAKKVNTSTNKEY